MSELPSGWALPRVGELITLNPKNDCPDETTAGFVPMPKLGTEFRSSVGFEPRLWGEIRKSYTHFADGDVLLAKITPCFENGKAGYVQGMPTGVGAGSSEYFVCRPIDSLLNPKILLALFKTEQFLKQGAVEMTGSVGHKRVPKEYLLNIEIPLPPWNEQNRIADKLDAVLARVDACRERLDRVPGILKRFRQSVLAAATSGKLTEEWRQPGTDSPSEILARLSTDRERRWSGRGKYKPAVTPAEVESEDFTSLPASWLRATLDQVTWSVKDGPHFSPKYQAEGVPFISGGSIKPGKIDLSIAKYISPTLHEEFSLRCRPERLDVLYTKGGTTGLAAVNTLSEDFNVWVHVAVLKLLQADLINPFYVQHALNSPLCYAQSQRYTHGVGNQDLGLTRMVKIVLPVPPVTEQNEIVRRVESLFAYADRIEARYTTARAQVERLTPALLAKAFRGELVPQDSNDEPASELLERVSNGRPQGEKATSGMKLEKTKSKEGTKRRVANE